MPSIVFGETIPCWRCHGSGLNRTAMDVEETKQRRRDLYVAHRDEVEPDGPCPDCAGKGYVPRGSQP